MAADPTGINPARPPAHHAAPPRSPRDRPGDARIQFLIEASVEMRFQAFLEGLPDAMLGVDHRGTVCFANRQAEKLFGRPRADLIGLWAETLLDGAAGASRPSRWHDSLANLDSPLSGTSLEFRASRADGGQVPVEITLSRVDTLEGPWVIAAVRDVTDRKHAEEALQASEARFRGLLNSAPDAAVIIDGEGNILLVNQQTERLFGYAREELVGQPVELLLPQIFRGIEASNRPGPDRDSQLPPMGAELELAGRGRDQSEFPVEISLSAIESDDGAVAMAFIRDITDRKAAEEALRTTQERYRQILATAGEAFVAFDVQGVVIDWNVEAERIFGWSRDEAINRHLQGLCVPESTWQFFNRLLTHRLDGAASQRMQATARRRNDEEFPIELTIWPSEGAEGERFNAFILDATDRRRAEEAVASARAEAERRAEELGKRNREIVMVSEMGDLLQSCITVEEVHQVLSQFGRRLFPEASGGIFLQNAAGNLLEAAVTWGPASPGALVFGSEDCWGLRRGRAHTEDRSSPRPRCPHRGPVAAGSICIPMMAQSQAMGLVHLVQHDNDDGECTPEDERVWESLCNLATTVAEHVALALANFQLRETLRTQSIRDPLTDLYNRRYLDESLERELRRASRDGKALSLVMIDIDFFKSFNDQFGHDSGDQLLTGLSRVLRDAVRGADIACRFGGEEFLLVLPDATLETAGRRAEELRERVRLLVSPSAEHPVTVSIGVAAYPVHAHSAQDLVRAADMALYSAKASGRDCVALAPVDPGLASSSPPAGSDRPLTRRLGLRP